MIFTKKISLGSVDFNGDSILIYFIKKSWYKLLVCLCANSAICQFEIIQHTVCHLLREQLHVKSYRL